MNKYDFTVFICRAQIFHNGHKRVVQQALAQSNNVILLVGSAHQTRNVRNPFNFVERKKMIQSAFSDVENNRVHILPLQDNPYNDNTWIANVQKTVEGVVQAYHSQIQTLPKIALIGHSKDQSSYYLKMFPQWSSIEVENFNNLNSTELRQLYFGDIELTKNEVPVGVGDFLTDFKVSEAFETIKLEIEFVNKYKKSWEKAPYPPIFVTTDAVVIQAGHVLLVERRAMPGKGLFALPGGFVEQGEKLEDSMLRELKEETRLKLPIPVLKGGIVRKEVFDDPYRSARGRTITTAFLIELKQDGLPKVKGGDDAAKAFWLPLSQLKPELMYEDHFFIIQHLIGN